MNALKAHLDKEKQKRIAEIDRHFEKYAKKEVMKQVRAIVVNLTFIYLMSLYEEMKCKWGKKRLLRVVENMQPFVHEFVREHEMQDEDIFWLCQRYLDNCCGITADDIADKLNIPIQVEVKNK